MRFYLPVIAFAGFVATQSIGDSTPACAGPCLNSAIRSATTCAVTNAACQCTVDNYRAIYTAALTCVLNACGADVSISQVLPAAEAFCLKAVGPISVGPPSSSSSFSRATSTSQAGGVAPAAAPTTSSQGSFVSGLGAPTRSSSSTVAVFTGGAISLFAVPAHVVGGLIAAALI